MGNEDLESIIRQKYQQGLSRAEIKQQLMDEGIEEEVIDATIAHIQQDAIRQIPGISHFYSFLDRMDSKTAHSSPKIIAGVLGASFLILLLVFVGLYFLFDPLNIKTTDRDKQRETDVVKVRSAIDAYYIAKNMYPAKLQDLMPTYLQSIPLDPKTGAQYEYKTYNGQKIYELCVTFEIQPSQCINSSTDASNTNQIIIATPTLSQSQSDLDITQAPSASASPSPVQSPSPSPKVTPTTAPSTSGGGSKAL